MPVYLRQTTNDLTGEHSCIMVNVLHSEEESPEDWLSAYWVDFRRRFLSLLSYQFAKFTPSLALSVLSNKTRIIKPRGKIIFCCRKNFGVVLLLTTTSNAIFS